MMGRAPGEIGDYKATSYVAAEFARVGLKPAGDNGTWFQNLPFYRRAADKRALLKVDNYTAKIGIDYAPQSGNARYRAIDGVSVVYAGLASDTATWIDANTAQGKVLLFSVVPPERRTVANRRTNLQQIQNAARFRGATSVFVAELDAAGGNVAAAYLTGSVVLDTTWRDVPPIVIVTNAFAARLLGRSVDGATNGTTGRSVSGSTLVGITPLEFAARNVVGILEGSDPVLKNEFVSVTAHNDHVGFDNAPVDHDSLRAFNSVVRPAGADSPNRTPTEVEARRIKQILDSLRKIRPPRLDSIRNGADDDGSGTVGILEIAELLASQKHPRRSILFVSHTAEEFGLLGSQWYTDHPTVNRDNIIGEIDIDMIGRGGVHDLPAGGPTYLEVVGIKRLSTEFGEVLEATNKRQKFPFVFNLEYDVPGHPLQYYCRADHYSYARYGIPSVSFSRGEHQDYHQVTDEPQYIDYDALARVATFVKDGALDLANRDARPKLDKPKTDPKAPCRQ
ncbi:MAG: M28 family peptidase [Gemmatimonadaceae bacterium]